MSESAHDRASARARHLSRLLVVVHSCQLLKETHLC